MQGEIDIEYRGEPLEIKYDFTKGKGQFNRDIPPEEDTVTILEAKRISGDDYPLEDIGTRWDLEMMIIEKVRD